MARLRKPSSTEPPTFIPPTSIKRTTRSSPRKVIHESPSHRELRYTSSQDREDPFLVPKAPMADSSVRKQRVLRPVASNSRLLRKLSDESLATPEKKGRRSEKESNGQLNYLYVKTLAKSVARKQGKKSMLGVEPEVQLEQETVMDENVEEVEKSILCGDEDELAHSDNENARVLEEEDDEDEPVVVVAARRRRLWRPARRPVSDSEEEETEDDDEEVAAPHSHGTASAQRIELGPAAEAEMPPPLAYFRSPHGKEKNTISNWAREVIDLSNSPESAASFVLQPPLRVRPASFAASSRPTSSASNDVEAVLQYSPTPKKLRSPRKAPPNSRPSTPPPPLSPSKLVSPSKKAPRIPKALDLRPSIDAFWNPEVVNDWNDKHSPSKPLHSPRKQKLFKTLEDQMKAITISDSDSDASFPSPITSPRKKKSQSPVKKESSTSSSSLSVAQVRAQRKDFAARKHALAEAFLTELDNTITSGRIAALSKPTGGIKLLWSKTLKTTAGRANWRREQLRLHTGPLPSDVRVEIRHHCSIELAEKVIDDEERLYNVLAHEYCHLTTFMLSGVRNNPHGAEFKAWGAKVSRAFVHRGVEVTTKHSYRIEYKFVWECVGCGYEFKRHSRSVDPARHSCGRCKGRLVQTKPVPRGGGGSVGATAGKREKSEYQVFVKENFGRVKREMEARGMDTQMGKVMEVVAKEYRERKGKGEGSVQKHVDEVGLALEGLKI